MRRTTALLLALAVTAAPVVARADGRAAAAAFAEGERAFAAGDFLRAGGSFEAAYREQPHWSPLWNAALSAVLNASPTLPASHSSGLLDATSISVCVTFGCA